MIHQQVRIVSLEQLHQFYAFLGEGATASGISSDLEAGNFDQATFEKSDGNVYEVEYVGPVAEGYVSPFEKQGEESELE